MGVILKIALRNMRRRKTRYILTIITLVLSVALFGGVMIVADSFGAMLLNGMDTQMGSADILIKPVNGTDIWFEPNEINDEIDSISSVDSIAYRITGFNVHLSSTDSGNQIDNSTRTLVFGINHTAKGEKSLGGRPFILDSIDSMSDSTTYESLLEYNDNVTGNRVIVITEALKIKFGPNFSAGDTIWILPYEGVAQGYVSTDTGTWIAYTVVAVVRDTSEARDFDAENPSDGYSSAQGPALFTSIINAHELVDGTEDHTGEYTLCAVGVNHIKRIAPAVLKLDEKLAALNDDDDWSLVDIKSDNLDMITNTMDMMEIMFMVFGLIALILSMILIMNVFNIIKKEQEYETGIFQAIGASKSETFKLFLTQGVVMGLIGAAIGTIFSYFISYVIFSVTVDTLQNLSIAEGFVPDSFQIILLPETIITTFVVGLGACIVASLYPSWKASRKPIIECLSPLEEKTKREKKHYIKRVISYIIGSLIIVVGVWMINMPSSGGGFGGGFGAPGGDNLNAFLGPTLVLLGIIWLLSLLLKYVNRGFVVLFRPYLRKTRLLTEKNILRHPKRTVLTFSMIALTTSFLIGMSIMMDSMREGVNTTVNNFVGGDARIYTYNTPRSFEEDLISLQGIEGVMGVSHQNARIQIEGEWIGHSSLETEGYNTSISTNVIDTGDVKKHISKIPIISPSAMTSDALMDELSSGNNVIIEKALADDYNIKVGDILPIDFSLGMTLANLTAMIYMDFYNAHEDTIIVNMSVVGIVESIPGFSTLDLLGGFTGGGGSIKTYNIFVAWTSYEEIASRNLPGGGTDMVFRQIPQTGNPQIDSFTGNWFNFSSIETLLDSTSGIDYYTTRMESYTLTSNGSVTDPATSVVGIHTNSTGKLKSDSFFGNNSLIAKNSSYLGSTMEELLDTSDNVCVVDETYIKNHPSAKIGDIILIYPKDSLHNESLPDTWEPFEIVGIIESPTFNNTERYNWMAGIEAIEVGFEVGGNSVYLNYEKTRDSIYAMYNDNITSVLLHSDHPKNISSLKDSVLTGLSNEAWNWTLIDVKSLSLEIRTFVYDWFAWVEAGASDEEVLETVLDLIESKKYLVLFSFTKTYMASNFKTILNMIVFIMNGLLLFAIIIAMIGLTLHSLLTTMSRRREIGMLRSIGLSKKGVIRSISGETIILALLGVFAGIFAGFVQGTLMVNNLPGGGFLSVTWTIPWLTIIILVTATLLTTIISSRYPAKWAANLNIIDAVRTR